MPSKITPLFALALILFAGPILAQNSEDCFDCHDDHELTNATGEIIYVAPELFKGSMHEDMDCIDCHEGGDFEDEPHWPEPPTVDCASCHDEQDEQYRNSWHAQRHPGDTRTYPTCATCHNAHEVGKHGKSGSTEYKQEIVLICSQCHQKDIENYVHSTHYRHLEDNDDDRAPSCTDCHDSHAIYKPTDPNSRVHPNNVSETCDACHTGHRASLHKEAGAEDSEVSCVFCHTGHQTDMTSIAHRIYKEEGIFNKCNYCHEKSQHEGDEFAHGSIMDAEVMGREVNCTECHQYHWKVEDGEATPHWTHRECGKCHEEQDEAWSMSAHGRSQEVGNKEPATCIDCHGENQILRPDLQFDSETIVATCSKCHGDRDLMLSYGINPYVVQGYKDTYHGKLYAVHEEGLHFATCTNCHGYHNILEPEDPMSSVNRVNILETCKQCHDTASENFVTYLVHPVQPTAAEVEEGLANSDTHAYKLAREESLALVEDPDRAEHRAFLQAFATADKLMKLLFVGVLSFFGLHTFLWFQRGIQPRLHHFDKRYYRRFSGYDRMLHVLVNMSFLMLAFTGLPQSYSHTVPGSWFFENVMSLKLAQKLHYIAAIITALYFFLHLMQLGWKLRKHGWRKILVGPDSMAPRKKDFVDFWQHLLWFLGRSVKPSFDRWTYWEKFDYFAVFWGVAVIGVSGLIRWNEEFFGNLLGGGVVSLADTIHKEEALMATAFIFIVHFFNTHFRSEKFPMDVSIYTGLITEEELREERPEQYERMKSQGQLESSFQGPRSAWHQILAYAWGTFALSLGLILLVLIIWGMVAGGH
ncbi:cytochrome c3 family protein [bacterium]|nr:cytochrome c3 family protein [bacterium]